MRTLIGEDNMNAIVYLGNVFAVCISLSLYSKARTMGCCVLRIRARVVGTKCSFQRLGSIWSFVLTFFGAKISRMHCVSHFSHSFHWKRDTFWLWMGPQFSKCVCKGGEGGQEEVNSTTANEAVFKMNERDYSSCQKAARGREGDIHVHAPGGGIVISVQPWNPLLQRSTYSTDNLICRFVSKPL